MTSRVIFDDRVKQAVDKANAAAASFDISGSASSGGFIKVESAVNPVTLVALATGDVVAYCVQADSLFECGLGVVSKAAHTLTRTQVVSNSSGSQAKIDFSGATATPLVSLGWGAWLAQSAIAAMMGVRGGARLTGTQGTPLTTAELSGLTTLYAEPHMGGALPLFMDTGGTIPAVAQLPASTASLALGTMTAARGYDVWLDIAATALGTISMTKTLWASATARTTGIVQHPQNGYWYKSGDYRFLLLASFYSYSTTVTEDNAGGVTTQVGGRRFISNVLCPDDRPLKVKDTANNWNPVGSSILVVNAATAPLNSIEWFTAVPGSLIRARSYSQAALISTGSAAASGMGLDSTSAFSGKFSNGYQSSAATVLSALNGEITDFSAIGYHKICWLEQGVTSGTSQFSGDEAGTCEMGIVATVRG